MKPSALFSYEQRVLQKLRQQNPPEEFNDTINFRFDSASVVLQPKSLLKELNTLIFRQREDFVTYDEFYNFLRRLFICDDPDQCLKMFRKLAGSAELFYLPDLTRFLSQDILKLEFSQMPMCELILRIGLEIFNHLSDENNELDLKQTIYFIKEDLHEDIDFLEIIDLFGFVQDIYSGQIISKQGLQAYFQKIAPQLRKAFSNILLKRIQHLIGSKRVQFHKRQKNQLITNEQVKSDIQKLLQKNFQINFDVEVEEKGGPPDAQDQIMNLVQQSKPKIRGWLQRLSLNKANKWQMLFLQIDQSTRALRAVKPESVKKVYTIQACNFVCLHEVIVLPAQGAHHRKTNSLNSHHHEREDFSRPVQTESANNNCPYSNAFFLSETTGSKLTLIKTWDIREIEQIFTDVKSDIDKDQNYSGIVDACIINAEPLDKLRSKYKSFAFKEHLLVIKDGKILLYNAIIKHQIDLRKTRITNEKELPFVPSHPYPFQLVIDDTQANVPQPSQYLKVQRRIENQDEQNSVIMFQIEEDENENSDKEDGKKGFFDQIYDKFKRKPTIRKKEIKLVLAAESEPKRRQWIFSLNYYRTNSADPQELVRHSNRSSFQTPVVSKGLETVQVNESKQREFTPKNSYLKSINNSQLLNISGNQNVFIGGNHTQINVGIFNIGGEDDFYDVFKGDMDVQRKVAQGIYQKQHCHTDPNEPTTKEQRLVTQPSNFGQGQPNSKQIYSTSVIELWQQFLLAFFKYLLKQKNHSIEEAQEPKIQALQNRQLKICKQK